MTAAAHTPSHHSTRALLARSVDYREADKICELLTVEIGRISTMARSARKSRRRFGGALSLFVLGQAEIKRPARGDLLELESFEAVEDFGGAISADVIKIAHGSYMIELARELWPPGQPEPATFGILLEALRVLAAGPASASLLRAFELRILASLGLGLLLDRCVACGRAAERGWTSVNVARGGLVCPPCGGSGQELSLEAMELLGRLTRIPLAESAAIVPERTVAREARDTLLIAVRGHLGKELRSLAFIAGLGGKKLRVES
jgi:DNA repair protein RecO (recombination protein O)